MHYFQGKKQSSDFLGQLWLFRGYEIIKTFLKWANFKFRFYLSEINSHIDFVKILLKRVGAQRGTLPPVLSSINRVFNRMSFWRFLGIAEIAELTASASTQVANEGLVWVLQIVRAGGEFTEDFGPFSTASRSGIDLLSRRQVEVLWREDAVVFDFCFFCLNFKS